MNNSEIQCDVCGIKLLDSEWGSHIDTKEHKEKTLTQIIEDLNWKDNTSDTRDETTEILEELELEYNNETKDNVSVN